MVCTLADRSSFENDFHYKTVGFFTGFMSDGAQVDDRTAWEIGYFYRGKPTGAKIIGIRTDFRRAGESEGAVVNAMIEGACDRIVRSREELMVSSVCVAFCPSSQPSM